MEPASSLIDLTLPVASSSSSRSHRRQSFMTPPAAVTDATHDEDGGSSPSDSQIRRHGAGAIEHGGAAGQGGASVSSQQEEGRALLPSGVVDAAVDDAAVRQASPLGEDVASESSGGHRAEVVAARRGHGVHAPLSRGVEGQTGAAATAAGAPSAAPVAAAAVAAAVATTEGGDEEQTEEAPVQPLGDSTNTVAASAGAGGGVGAGVVVAGEAKARPAPTGEEGESSVKRPKKKRKKMAAAAAEASDGERCSVCLDPWTSKGKHRICTLLCGHLFGKSCIERWLKERRSCPQCGAKVGPKGSARVIPLFLHNLVATDTGELETLRSTLEEEKRLRKQSEKESVRLSIRNASLEDQLSRFRRQQQQQQQQQHQRKQQQSVPVVEADSSASNVQSQLGGGGAGCGREGGCNHPITIGKIEGTLAACPTSGPACLTRNPYSTAGKRTLPSPSPQRTPLPPPPPPLSAPSPYLSHSRGDSNEADVCNGSSGGGGSSGGDGSGGSGGGEGGAVDGGDGEPSSSHGTARSSSSSSSSRDNLRSSSSSRHSIDSSSIGSSSIDGSIGSISRISGGTTGGSSSSSRGREVRFERLFSKGVREGRVAAFAGGNAGALLVSQELGEAGGLRGSAWHGVTKFSLADLRHHKSIRLHRAQVRDVKFSSHAGGAGYILTTSFDKTLKVCDVRTDSVVVEYGLEGNGWSCQWSATNPSQMFCGIVDSTRTAAVLLFDLRSTSGAVRKLRAAARQRQPVHTICHTESDRLLCATMGGVWGWEGGTTDGEVGVGTVGGGGGGGVEQQQEQTATQMQIQAGACCSLSHHGIGGDDGGYERSSGAASSHRFLVSTRGSSASHAVFGLDAPRNRHHPSPSSPPRRLRDREGSGTSGAERVDADKGLEATGTGMEAAEIAAGGGSITEGESEETTAVPAEAAVSEGSSEEKGRDGGERGRRPGLYPPRLGEVAGLRPWTQGWMKQSLGARGHQSHHTLSRSLLWDPSRRGDLLIAGGDEGTNKPWIWDASSGDVCRRLEAHSSPVLDVASLQSGASGKGLFAAVSRGELRVYETSLP